MPTKQKHRKSFSKRMGIVKFQLKCKYCFEIINIDDYFVPIFKNGKPLKSSIKRVFSFPEFNNPQICPCCKKENFKVFDYAYEVDNTVINDDLPF